MSVINKKPFIKSLLDLLTDEQLATLMNLMNGEGNQTAILRTLNIKPMGNRTHITAADKGISLCNLEIHFSLYKGYLIYVDVDENSYKCVLITFTDSQKLMMFDIDVEKLNFATIDEELSVLELRTEVNHIGEGVTEAEMSAALALKQNTLVSGTNIKTVNNESLLGSGNVEIKTYRELNPNWDSSSSSSAGVLTSAYCAAIYNDANAVVGNVYSGTAHLLDTPVSGGASWPTIVVEILKGRGDGHGGFYKLIHLTLISPSTKPGHWEYMYSFGGQEIGWRPLEFDGDIEIIGTSSTPYFILEDKDDGFYSLRQNNEYRGYVSIYNYTKVEDHLRYARIFGYYAYENEFFKASDIRNKASSETGSGGTCYIYNCITPIFDGEIAVRAGTTATGYYLFPYDMPSKDGIYKLHRQTTNEDRIMGYAIVRVYGNQDIWYLMGMFNRQNGGSYLFKATLNSNDTNVSLSSNVIYTEANPTLAGTESELTSIDIDGTKYKVISSTDVSNAIDTAILGAINDTY